MSDVERLDAQVSGRVQGVGFRAFVASTARGLSLTGTCRNLPCGDVEISAEGTHDSLVRLAAALREGPPHGHVSALTCRWSEASESFDAFTIARV